MLLLLGVIREEEIQQVLRGICGAEREEVFVV